MLPQSSAGFFNHTMKHWCTSWSAQSITSVVFQNWRVPAVSDWWHLLPGTTLVRWHCFLPSFAWHHTEHHIVLGKWVQFANQPQKFRSLVFWVLCLLCACWSAVPWLAMLPPGNLREFHDFQHCCKASCQSSDSSCFLLWSKVLRLKMSG